MAGKKMARIRKCHRCPHRRTAHAEVWRWPHCVYGEGDIELADQYMEGPEENCPAGFWTELEPVDLEAESQQNQQRLRQHVRKSFGLLLEKGLRRMSEANATLFLVEIVEAGDIPDWLAEELATQRGLKLDAAIGRGPGKGPQGS